MFPKVPQSSLGFPSYPPPLGHLPLKNPITNRSLRNGSHLSSSSCCHLGSRTACVALSPFFVTRAAMATRAVSTGAWQLERWFTLSVVAWKNGGGHFRLANVGSNPPIWSEIGFFIWGWYVLHWRYWRGKLFRPKLAEEISGNCLICLAPKAFADPQNRAQQYLNLSIHLMGLCCQNWWSTC